MSWLDTLFRIGGATAVAITGNKTLDKDLVLSARLLVLQGTLTGIATLTVPLVAGLDLVVVNQTTGGFPVVVKGPSGGGIVVSPGAARSMICTGTDYSSIETPMRESADGIGRAGIVGEFSIPSAVGGVGETLALINVAPLVGSVPATIMLEMDVVCLIDDASQSYASKVMRGFRWSGSALTPINTAYALFENDDTGSVSAGITNTATQFKLIVSGSAEYRWFASVRATVVKYLP